MSDFPDDTMFTREKAAAALSDLGYPVSKATLATLASRSGGPRYCRFGKRVLYRWADLVDWSKARCGPTVRTTSELDAA